MLHRGNPHVAAAARRVFDESDRYRSIVWDAALAPLAVFLDPTIASHSRTSDLDWQDFLSGRQPVSLFLCMQFRDIERLGGKYSVNPSRLPEHYSIFRSNLL